MKRGLGVVILLVCLALTLAQMRGCNVRVTPTPAPTPRTQTTGYVYRFPTISKSGKTQLVGHGLVALNGERFAPVLSPDWCYVYRYDVDTTSGCITKVVHFTTPTTCPAILLLGNEPNNSGAAGGYPTDPASAAIESQAVRAKCSNTFIVAPNIAGNLANAIEWADAYFAAGGVADAFGFHVYSIGDADGAISRVRELIARYANNRGACLLEYGDPVSVAEFAKYADWVRNNLYCSAVWVDNWDYDKSMNLVNADGTLTARGRVWAK